MGTGILVLTAILIFGLSGAYRELPPAKDTPTPVATTTDENIPEIFSDGDGTIVVTPVLDLEALPDLDRSFVDLSITGEQRANLKLKLAEISTALKEDPNDYYEWLNLAAYRKVSLDYAGAIEIWEFMTEVWTDDPVAYMNLANYYHYTLHEPVRAESYYRTAMQKDPSRPDSYIELHNLYKDVYTAKRDHADDVLIEGIVANPKDVSILYTLARYYAESRDKVNARKRYNELEAIATEIQDANLLARIARDRADYGL